MLRKIYSLFFPVFILLLAGGCQKASINGDLDGRWQMVELETESDIENVLDQQLYYNFYLHVCSLSYYGGTYTDGNFSYLDNEISISFPYLPKDDISDTILPRYGIFSNPVSFQVIYLDKKKLIIQNDESIITLRKF